MLNWHRADNMDVQPLFDMLPLWPTAARNYKALESVLVRDLCEQPIIKLMFNPERVRSTMAKVDMSSISERPCFLCAANRPQEQRALFWRNYDVLVNPYPIFSHHLTIVERSHTQQTIVGRVGDMFALALELPTFSIFFNGASCGASAPDHAHFQAGDGAFCPAPIQVDVDRNHQSVLYDEVHGQILVSESAGRLVYHIVCFAEKDVNFLFEKLWAMRRLYDDMVNVVAHKRDGSQLVDFYVIPRRMFRPWQFSAEDKEQILVSPASVEVSGILVVPRQEDFEKIDQAVALDVLRQVCFRSDSELIRR